jgi:predicted ATPase/DNA-binding winged helix-turn-helix (wHTH) protein
MDEASFTFAPFRLIPSQRLLLEDGRPLRLGSRAMDILITLVESVGETIPKERLIASTWPNTSVSEGALRVHVAALRKALSEGHAGKRYIANVPGRGYRLVAPVTLEQRPSAITQPNTAIASGNLPVPLTRIVGRDDIIAALQTRLTEHRFLTVVGPGGIGKTTVAVAVAEAVRPSYKDGTAFVELSSLADPDLVPNALCTSLGISPSRVDPISGLKAWLQGKHTLIVLDNCEHVVTAAAHIAEALLRAAPHIHIMATSREPLRAEGEWLCRLASLEVPPEPLDYTTLGDALHYSAVALFIERAGAIVDGLSIHDADLPAVIKICRRLDGIPLALELAAAQTDVFGIKCLAARLDNCFEIMTQGRRTALTRHQTLRATMDWSYDLLPEAEQLIFRHLSVFVGEFTMEAAVAIATSDRSTAADVLEGLHNLAMKSLLMADISGEPTFYRLLDTTRLYALEKLMESDELEQLKRRHAEFYRDLFERAAPELEMPIPNDRLTLYRRRIDNIRAALEWAFSPGGDATLGIALTAAAVPLWVQLSLLDECRERVERAISVTSAQPSPDAYCEMKLWAALGLSSLQTKNPATVSIDAWMKVLGLAEKCDDVEFQLRALLGLFNWHCAMGKHVAAQALARRFCGLAESRSTLADFLVGQQMLGHSLHQLGKHRNARHHIEHVLDRHVTQEHRSHTIRFQFDQKVGAYASLALILWVQGFPEQAVRMAQAGVERANAIDHSVSLCIALGDAACPIELLIDDLPAAERDVAILLDCSARHRFDRWNVLARTFEGTILIRHGNLTTGLQLLHTARDEQRKIAYCQRSCMLLGWLAEGFGRAGQVAQGLLIIDEALAPSEPDEEHGYLPELHRIKGELLMLEGKPDAAAAGEEHFQHALHLARRQGALSWELRAATSLARLWRNQHRVAEAVELLASVYRRFTEGFATRDLQAAKELLER